MFKKFILMNFIIHGSMVGMNNTFPLDELKNKFLKELECEHQRFKLKRDSGYFDACAIISNIVMSKEKNIAQSFISKIDNQQKDNYNKTNLLADAGFGAEKIKQLKSKSIKSIGASLGDAAKKMDGFLRAEYNDCGWQKFKLGALDSWGNKLLIRTMLGFSALGFAAHYFQQRFIAIGCGSIAALFTTVFCIKKGTIAYYHGQNKQWVAMCEHVFDNLKDIQEQKVIDKFEKILEV